LFCGLWDKGTMNARNCFVLEASLHTAQSGGGMLPHRLGSCGTLIAIAVLLISALPLLSQVPTLNDFGFQSMSSGGVMARGGLPLVLIVAEFENEPALLHPDRDFKYYQDLIFDGTATNSLNGFILENSNGRFW
jgi:hypothetical protein